MNKLINAGWLFACGLCLVVLLLKATPTIGAENDLWLNLGGPSHHVDREHPWNEKNYGLGLRYEYDDVHSIAAGFYRNSLRNTTYYAAIPYMPLKYEGLSAGFAAGVVAGGYNIKWAPYALPTVRYEINRMFALNLVYVPKLITEVYWLNFEVRLK